MLDSYKNSYMQKKRIMIRYLAILIAVTGYLSIVVRQRQGLLVMATVTDKKVAITFDDGPNENYTADLLKGLKERGVLATFFLLGAEVEKYPKLTEQIYADGHLIGTHSYQHVNLCNLTDEKAIEQIVKTNQIIEKITGECPQFIRPPFGSWKKELDYNITMIEVLWDVDPKDWCTNNTDCIVKRVVKNVKDGDIILLHDASSSSVEAALQIIDCLQADGYQFVTVEELVLN